MPLKMIPYNAALPLNTHIPTIEIEGIGNYVSLTEDLLAWAKLPGYGLDEAYIDVPVHFDHRAFAERLGKVMLAIEWQTLPLKKLYVRCTTQESFDVINNYFMGTWNL